MDGYVVDKFLIINVLKIRSVIEQEKSPVHDSIVGPMMPKIYNLYVIKIIYIIFV